MWVHDTNGFFSVVAHRDDHDYVVVRARVLGDLLRLLAKSNPGDRNIAPRTLFGNEMATEPSRLSRGGRPIVFRSTEADYEYRVVLHYEDWCGYLGSTAASIDYDNFKSAAERKLGKERASVLHDVWALLCRRLDQRGRRRGRGGQPSLFGRF